jgi:pyruvate dehydrogenase E2 component (dihydrolipoyllysine-residue acetyltransferase)
MPTDMNLPELGENVESGDVLRVLVKPGDRVKKDQPVLELETDKATIEVPSSAEGVVAEVKVKAGEKVKVGQTIFTVDSDGSAAAAQAAPPPAQNAPAPAQASKPQSGPKAVPPPSAPPAEEPARPAAPPARRPAQVVEMTRPKAAVLEASAIPAAPAARRLARELGVNLQDIQGSGPAGRVSMDDVTAFARRLLVSGGTAKAAAVAPLPDFSTWGPIERKPMSGVRRTTAHRLTQAWTTVPHVVQHDRADITGLESLRKKLSKQSEAAGRAPVTLTAFLMKTIAAALRKFPQVNSSVDLASDEIIFKQYCHIGVAVDTDRGLLVPVVRDVDQKDLFQLADEIAQAAEKARARKLSLDEMQGGSFTISNLGSLGGGPFSPIVNWPEVAILGVARAKMEPVWSEGQFVPRLMMPLSLSYDHRVVDGADGVRFLRWVVEAIEQPALVYMPE